jgi:hypothetical protein
VTALFNLNEYPHWIFFTLPEDMRGDRHSRRLVGCSRRRPRAAREGQVDRDIINAAIAEQETKQRFNGATFEFAIQALPERMQAASPRAPICGAAPTKRGAGWRASMSRSMGWSP